MVSHAAAEHGGETFELPCERCEVVMDIGQLEGHRKECQAGGRIPCDVCGRTFAESSPHGLQVHKFKEHLINRSRRNSNERRFTCCK